MATSHRLNKTVAPLGTEFTPSEVEGPPRSRRDGESSYAYGSRERRICRDNGSIFRTTLVLRARLIAALGQPDSRVIVNFNRASLGQEGEGHFSPLVAYDPASNSFLILDVAR